MIVDRKRPQGIGFARESEQKPGLSDQLIRHSSRTTGALGEILILAVVVVVCNEGINRAESYLLRCAREKRKRQNANCTDARRADALDF